jgi:hypothetical protein
MYQISAKKTDQTSHHEKSEALLKFELKNKKNGTEGKKEEDVEITNLKSLMLEGEKEIEDN